MTVEPGFGGQKLIPECVGKATELKRIREEKGYSYIIEADGGINLQNYPSLGEAGVDCSVMGSAVFGIEAGERNAKICSINGKEI
jgi:ribulose-phosphate 3-epimerase